MTKREAIREFNETVLPTIKARERPGKPDMSARREAWNNWTDALCKEGRITAKQYDSWDGPFG